MITLEMLENLWEEMEEEYFEDLYEVTEEMENAVFEMWAVERFGEEILSSNVYREMMKG